MFTEEYVEREKNAVHSEYRAKIKSDQRRALDVFKAVVNPRHPFAKFSVGNLDTLSAEEGGQLRNKLLDFYASNYSASVMTLVVLGRESLPELEAMVRARFSAVANNDKVIEAIAEPLFEAGSLPMIVQIQPEKEQRVLSIAFPTEQEVSFYQKKPLHYLGNILGHEGQGSLLSYLKQQGWAEALSAGTGLSYSGGATFNITIKLTPAGVEQLDNIVASVFQTINRIARSDESQRLYNEQRALAEQQFRYREMTAPIQYVSALSANMHYYPQQDFLRGSSMMTVYDEALLQRFLTYLTPENSFVTLNAPEVKVDKQTHFYAARYSLATPSSEQLERWSDGSVNAAITLPQENKFIAADLSVKALDTSIAATENSPPELLSTERGLRLWYKQDQRFDLPKGSVLFSLRSPLANFSAEHRAMLSMYTAMVADQLNELSYPASLAGLAYTLNAHGRGFSLKISGFDDKQGLLLDEILAALDAPQFDPQRFELLREENIRHLQNAGKEQPYTRVMGQLSELLHRQQWSEQSLLAAYKTMTLENLKVFKQQLLAAGEIDMLVYGNYLKTDAQHYAEKVTAVLLKAPVSVPAVEILNLQPQTLSRKVLSDYSDAALVLYLQAADTDKKRRAALGVTAQILRADFYTRLRTEKQLGYIVSSGAYPVMDVAGIFFLVQSPVAGPAALREEISRYLSSQIEMAASLDEQQFLQHRDALIVRLAESPKNLWEQSAEYWQDISRHYYQFDFKDQLIVALQSLTLEEWQQYFKQDVVGGETRAIWLYAEGQFDPPAGLEKTAIEDVSGFKSQQTYYSFP